MSNSTTEQGLPGKVALITGAGQGIGQGIAFSLAKRGVKIVAVGRTVSKCEATVAQISERFGTDAVALECDIGELDALPGLVDAPKGCLCRLDQAG